MAESPGAAYGAFHVVWAPLTEALARKQDQYVVTQPGQRARTHHTASLGKQPKFTHFGLQVSIKDNMAPHDFLLMDAVVQNAGQTNLEIRNAYLMETTNRPTHVFTTERAETERIRLDLLSDNDGDVTLKLWPGALKLQDTNLEETIVAQPIGQTTFIHCWTGENSKLYHSKDKFSSHVINAVTSFMVGGLLTRNAQAFLTISEPYDVPVPITHNGKEYFFVSCLRNKDAFADTDTFLFAAPQARAAFPCIRSVTVFTTPFPTDQLPESIKRSCAWHDFTGDWTTSMVSKVFAAFYKFAAECTIDPTMGLETFRPHLLLDSSTPAKIYMPIRQGGY